MENSRKKLGLWLLLGLACTVGLELLATRLPQETWANLPADRHSQGCNFSFADGHAEHWKWKAAKGSGHFGEWR